ncbi:MAG: hypothetical protein ABI947_07275 [Chloroflexota bacterium]
MDNMLHDPNNDLPEDEIQADNSEYAPVDQDIANEPITDEIDESSEGLPEEAPLQIRDFGDLTLLEMLPLLVRHPVDTVGALRDIINPSVPRALGEPRYALAGVPITSVRRPYVEVRRSAVRTFDLSKIRPLLGLGITLIIALVGSLILVNSKGTTADGNILIGGPLLLIGGIGMAIITARGVRFVSLPPLVAQPPNATFATLLEFINTYWLRIALFAIAGLWAVGSWLFNTDNNFTGIGVFCWVMSAATLAGALLDRDLYIGQWFDRQIARVRRFVSGTPTIKVSWTLIALVVIMFVGAGYRFSDLFSYPPEMTSDHVEKLLDSLRVYEGSRPIFFPNNGGRESFQMYFLAALKGFTGQPFSFELLKFGTGLEGMVMILLAWWMGRAVIGEEDRQLGNLTGVIMAALVATSYWHTLLSRLGLRIVTTTLVTTIIFIFLARALRHNRRTDYLITGFAVGAGMYFYQAMRMVPVVVVVGFVLTLLMRGRSWRLARQYTLNMIALVLMALVVFLPLGHYMVQNPGQFWQRTERSIFGEATRDDASGKTVEVPLAERLAAFRDNIPELSRNIVNSLLMFNWKGDRSWFNGAPDGTPALDFFTGAVFVLGLGIVAIRIARRRDPIDLLLPLSILIMVLPSALAIAFSIEVPGFTRASGSLPMVYLVAALGLAVILRLIMQRLEPGWPRRVVYGTLALLFVIGAMSNSTSYFVNAMADYRNSTLPYRQAGSVLRGFIDSTGAPGNAYIVAYKYWWDHRAVAIEAGDPHWPNTLPDPENLQDEILNLMRQNAAGSQPDNPTGKYVVQPDRQLMFFVNPEDTNAQSVLKSMFPNGTMIKISAYNTTRDFLTYIVPPVGCEWLTTQVGGNSPYCP